MLTLALENWLTDAGDVVVGKRSDDPSSLTPIEALIYEIWVLDTEIRNGGLSQYFCNRGIGRWRACSMCASGQGLEAFSPFRLAVEELVGDSTDPYKELIGNGDSADDLWYSFQESIISQLKQLSGGAS